ncbi:hypothetical protein NKR23_g3241 [Pleurostoma richardsiae]|uniref:Uncharacterized protein n=1 Tax=Pleurostoma richardsiae TaxID=41990 RepID=A0AA38RZX1_9PEZI|nr:hypothetical protein NKR23_g3241 [Pleurostoma richardsiae]
MAIQGATQALIAAFAFGIVVNAASAALFLNVKGQGPALRDGLRLVLITFFLSSALWAQVDFITTLINTDATSSCQIAIVFTTLFDQLARFSIEQCLLWAINGGAGASTGQMIAQGLVAARFILGGVFVGLSRPQFKPVCVPTSSVLPVAIVVVALDAVIIATLAGRAFSVGIVKSVRENGPESGRGKAILLVIVGVAVWTGTSVAMLLGSRDIELVFRTTVPAAGLSILILVVTFASGVLVVHKDSRPARLPEAPSPRRINISRDISTSDSVDYPPSRYEDLKREQVMSVTAFVQPREAPAPMSDRNGLVTTISGPVSGISGLPVKGELFPPMRENVEPRRVDVRPQNKQKKGLLDMKGGSASARIVISNPVLQEGNGRNPLDKIQTIDLEEAARADRERRAAQRQSTTLIAQRPAPQPPSMPLEEAVKRSISTKRKVVASTASQPNATASMDWSGLMAAASTTSAQLSPGVEEIRRRSPRQPPVALEKAPAAVRPSSPPQQPTQRAASPPQQPAGPVRPQIRPSRQRLPSPKTPPPEPTKTPLQRRPTTGLPNNPRAQTVRKLSDETGRQRQQTIMFVNDIVYNDPTLVESVMNDASEKALKAAIPATPATADSVVNRPRPIPRKSDKDRATFYAAEASPGHRRSRSIGSLPSRKSILKSQPGSPTQLPPLPPPPKSAGNPARPQPNDTKSMTFDEKMNLFFPAPPGGAGAGTRRSSVPEVPALPATFLGSSPTESDNESRSQRTRNSNRTTKTSIRTENILDVDNVDELPQRDVSNLNSEYRLSPSTYKDIADEMGRSWLPSFREDGSQGPIRSANKRASSPVIPVRESSVTAETASHDDEITTNWGSVHSPIAARNLAMAVQNARTTYIQKGERGDSAPRIVSEVSSFGGELTVMLDTSVPHDMGEPRGSWLLDDETIARAERASQIQWHRRVGDECPSFSDRKSKTKSRRIPPTPLLLNGKPSANKQAVLIQAAEPSPLESPEAALKVIQAQLRKLDQPNRDSAGSEGQRIALLENLEMEMGQQESHWLQLQHDMSRDSISTLQTSPTVESRRTSVNTATIPKEVSVKTIANERRHSRRARLLSGSSTAPKENSSQGPEVSRANLWKQRLAEAQTEYMDNVVDIVGKRKMNFLTVSKAELGSPTPPDTDESDQEYEVKQSIDSVLSQGHFKPAAKTLWTAPSPVRNNTSGLMWTPPIKLAIVLVGNVELPGLSVRPASRKESSPLEITSDRLWQKPRTDLSHTLPGLWIPPYMRAQALARASSQKEPQHSRQRAPPPRPLTQRPPRRSRRVTMLPDILESPEPLPDKRGTLGIFQFPWGERSDTASVQPKPAMFMAMPGTMTSGGPAINAALEARAKQLEADEYSSSFFDDYDEEVDSDAVGEESDDDFDETTLWEIASLLKTENVPSKNSMFPPALPESVVDDYITEIPFEDEGDVSRVAEDDRPQPLAPQKPLWTARREKKRGSHGKGLPHPDDETWKSYDNTKETSRATPRKSEAGSIESTTLWRPAAAEMEPSEAAMWSPRSALWVFRKQKQKGDHGKGLPQPDPTTWERYDSTKETIRAQPRPAAQQPVIESTGLWKQTTVEMRSSEFGVWSPKSALWVASMEKKKGSHGKGLPHPDEQTWGAYDNVKSTARAKPRRAGPAVIASDRLWRLSPSETSPRTSPMWSPEKPTSPAPSRIPRPVQEHGNPVKSNNPALWLAPAVPRDQTRGLFNAASGRSQFRTTTAAPAALEMARKPRSAGQKPLDRLISTTLWVAEPATRVDRSWIHAALEASPRSKHTRIPAPKAGSERKEIPLRRQHRPTVAVRADWDAALQEAIAASYPSRPVLRRIAASAADWDAALREAISSSYLPSFDASTRHPVFAASSLATTVECFHPAATGYTHSVAAVHPCFFGSLALTCPPEHVHPAMSSPAATAVRQTARRPSVGRESRIPTSTRDRSRSRPPRAEDITAAVPEIPAAIMAQIEALEQERLFAERFARRSLGADASPSPTPAAEQMPEVPTRLWTKPAEPTGADAGAMWDPQQQQQQTLPKAPSSPVAASPAPSRKNQRRAESLADLEPVGEQAMWTRAEGEERQRRQRAARSGGDKDWLDEGVVQKRGSRIQLRY